MSAKDEFVLDGENEYRALARVLMFQGQLDEALGLLTRLQQAAESAGANCQLIEILVLQALALQEQNKPEQALLVLERALTIAEPEGYVRSFTREGAPLARLLHQVAARGTASVYVDRLLAAFVPGREIAVSAPPQLRPQPLTEPLTPREMEVLKLIAAGASNPEIAEKLVIAVNTVKKHVGNIFGKLEATSRTQAVARARELGILD